MKIQYLIDLKNALKDIPDEVLDNFGFGLGEDSEEIALCVWDEEFFEKWDEQTKKYPQLLDISKWIKNIYIANKIVEADEIDECEQFMEEPISSEDNILKENAS